MKNLGLAAVLVAMLLIQIAGLFRGIIPTRWEYHTVSVSEFPVEGDGLTFDSSGLTRGPFTQYLNMGTELTFAGNDGWELVGITNINGTELVFKRRR